MRLLVLGGTAFLSHAVATAALKQGHQVTCAARQQSGQVPKGADWVHLDRRQPDWSELTGDWDAVVDVARVPSWVREALDELADRTGHWTFVSSISVYADHETLGLTPATARTLPVIHDDVEQDSAEKYGGSKLACEELVTTRAARSLVVRPGLLIGPGDVSGRFGYWAERLAEGGEVLAPEPADQPVQLLDVRDLAEWIVAGAEQGRTGLLDAAGPVRPFTEVLAAITKAVGGDVTLTWLPGDFLDERRVQSWAGPRSLPLWLPPQHLGMMTHDTTEFLGNATLRPLVQTAADTVDWLRSDRQAPRTGLTRAEEQDLLDDWHTIRA